MSARAASNWLRPAAFFMAIAIVGWGTLVVVREPVTSWFLVSACVWMALLLASAFWHMNGSFVALAATSLSATVVGRLFSTVQIVTTARGGGTGAADLLLQVETGAGVPGFGYPLAALAILLFLEFMAFAARAVRSAKGDRTSVYQDWTLAFIRIYVGLMFVPHFAGHLFAGPQQFAIYTSYFASLGMPYPAAQLLLAGTVEVIASIGLVFGLMTRPIALLAAVYLFLTMLLGGHFTIGYVWILPNGGYEFGVLWAVLSAVFVVQGGGAASVDNLIRRRPLFIGHPTLQFARFLFS